MGNAADLELARRVQKADGTQPIVDAVIRGVTFFALNAGPSDILPGQPVGQTADSSNEEKLGSIPRWDLAANQAIPKFVIPVVLGGGAVVKLIGVALDTIKVGEVGEVAGCGCFIPAYCDVNFGSHGQAVVAGASPGSLTVTGVRPAVGEQLGLLVFRATTAQGGTGISTMLGLLVNPC